jgi:hypothetical protein
MKFIARSCALCGKTQAQGESLMAVTTLVEAALKANFKLKNPASRYLSPVCANKLRVRLIKLQK